MYAFPIASTPWTILGRGEPGNQAAITVGTPDDQDPLAVTVIVEDSYAPETHARLIAEAPELYFLTTALLATLAAVTPERTDDIEQLLAWGDQIIHRIDGKTEH